MIGSRRSPERGGIFGALVALLVIVVLCAVIYLLRRPILRAAGEFWIVQDPLAASDAIVILGDDNFNAERAARAAELLRAGWAPRIVASGRMLRPYTSIADLMERDLTDRGVPPSAIVKLTHKADSTREEGEAIAQLIAQRGWKKVIVVTSNYHTRRSRYILSRVLPAGVVLRLAPAPDSEFDPAQWWTHRRGVKIYFHEAVGLLLAFWEMRDSDPRTVSLLVPRIAPAL